MEAAYPCYVKIHYMGATRTTTGSMYLVEVNGHRILPECGLYQGRREESIRRNREFSFDPTTLDAVVLSHAHIDHAGNLPNLCRMGYQGNIYWTFATRDLCAVMLEDSARVQLADSQHVSRIDVFSGHAGRSELIGYVKSLSGSLRKITVIHGEECASLAFGQAKSWSFETCSVSLSAVGQSPMTQKS